MKKASKIIKCIIFFIIGIFIFQVLTHIFVPKWLSQVDPATPRIKGIYEEEKNSLDVLVIGASDVGRGYSLNSTGIMKVKPPIPTIIPSKIGKIKTIHFLNSLNRLLMA